MQTIDEVIERIKESGLRVTPQRIAILRHLNEQHSHPTADEIYSALKDDHPSLSVATVYNTLKAFCDAGIVKELLYGDNASRFDMNTALHHHLICERCGAMTDVYLPEIALDDVIEDHEFVVKNIHVEIKGLCRRCYQQEKADLPL